MSGINKRIAVLGAGFAGVWSALGAARKLEEIGAGGVEVVVVNPHDYHSIRVRNYEEDLADTVVPLDRILNPAGIRFVQGRAERVHVEGRELEIVTDRGPSKLPYDRLVLAAGSELVRPPIPGLDHAFDVDTYAAALRLNDHLHTVASQGEGEGAMTAVVVGAGLTGVELAAELPERLRKLARNSGGRFAPADVRVILIDRAPRIGHEMGEAQPVIEKALRSLGVEFVTGATVASIDAKGITFADGSRIPAQTVAWCAGMRASPIAAQLGVPLDPMGRVHVDEYMRVVHAAGVFAAGDVANACIDGVHDSVMSCQHGRPMGRYAGHNVVSDLFGLPMLPLHIDWYTTVLDLGPWGAVYTEGWSRLLAAEGALAKQTKQTINRERIYPPRSGERRALLEAAAPVVQAAPPRTTRQQDRLAQAEG